MSVENSPASKPKILVVDDSRMMRVTITKYLSKEFDVDEADNGQAGWEKVDRDQNITMVITDANMPVLDGYELIKKIRASDKSHVAKLPVIMITGAEEESVREKALETGATDFIVKPPEKAQLLARVRANVKATVRTRELEATSKALAEDATMDPVTQLASRKYFLMRSKQDFSFAYRHGNDIAIIMAGVDHFERFFNNHGQAFIDTIRQTVAQSVRQILREEDTVACYDEKRFAILAPSCSRQQAAVIAERLRKTIAGKPVNQDNISTPVTLSMSVVSLRGDRPKSVDAAVKAVLEKLSVAQQNGGNQLIIDESDSASVETVTDIQEALNLIQNGETQRVVASLPELLNKMLPLLQLAAKHYRWKLSGLFEIIKHKLTPTKRAN